MRKYFTVIASFVIMLCIGSVYAWSIIAAELIEAYGFSAFQSQVIFGTLIATFPVTMIFAGRWGNRFKYRYFGYISGALFFGGYFLAGYSEGSFIAILIGIGVLSGIATGFGYWVALTSPVHWFPQKKGLVTGIAAAGFGLGAVFMSEWAELLMNRGYTVLQLLKTVGLVYGVLIVLVSNLIYQIPKNTDHISEPIQFSKVIRTAIFRKLSMGLFLGTFAGLLIIGSLGMIGGQYNISDHILIVGVVLFAIANFAGRLFWGFISDYSGAALSIFSALLFQSLSILSLSVFNVTESSYLILASLIGFGFGGNFVLFAKETAQVFGVDKLGVVYPYVFIGYGFAGIFGPISGGYLYDVSGSFLYAIILASFMSLMGSLLFLPQILSRRNVYDS